MNPILPKPPFLPLPSNWWEKIIVLGERIWNLLFHEESGALGKKKPVGRDSTVDDITEINHILMQARQKVEAEARELDRQLSEMVLDFTEDIRFAADLNNPVFREYPVNFRYFDRLLDSVPHKMEHMIGNTVSHMASMDSAEFYEALRMMPGARKEERISELLHKATETSLNNAIETVEKLFGEVVQEYCDAVSDAVSRAALSAESISEQLGRLTSAEENKSTVAEQVAAGAESVRQAALLLDSVLNLEEEL